MIEINLVPDVKQELIKAQRIRSTVVSSAIFVAIVSVGIVALLAIYVFAVQTVRSAVADDAIKKGSAKLASVQDLSKTLTIQNQLTKISALHNQSKIDSRIFDVLTAIIPPAPNEVQISNLTIDASTSVITMEGQASNGYSAVEIFRKTIEGAQVKFTSNGNDQTVSLASNVNTGDTSYGEDSSGAKVLRFTISFTYDEALFSPSSTNATVVISTQGNVTDSYIGLPQSIFVDRAKDLQGAQ
jgi:Tfp pilus assembly protein PilN